MKRGLTLIELILTIGLSAIIAIPVGLLLSEQLNGALRARDSAVAMSLARYELERLDSLNNFCHADLAITAPAGVLLTGAPFSSYPSYEVRRIVSCQAQASATACTSACVASPAATDNAIKRVEVVATRSGTTDRVASLVTYRSKYVTFGP